MAGKGRIEEDTKAAMTYGEWWPELYPVIFFDSKNTNAYFFRLLGIVGGDSRKFASANSTHADKRGLQYSIPFIRINYTEISFKC